MAVAFDSRVVAAPRILGVPEPWFHLALGALLAPLLAVTPLLSLVGWYLAALVHEMGHAAFSWGVGVPAVPAIGITAEAATMHGDQLWLLALALWGVGGFLLWRLETPVWRYSATILLGVLYPVVAFIAPLREAVHLLSGHLAELSFAAVCLARALSGGFSESPGERCLYAVLGWFLVGRNLVLTAGLVASSGARAQYATTGSFGLENDYLRLANEFGVSIEAVALGMTAVALLTAPAVVGWWSWRERSTA